MKTYIFARRGWSDQDSITYQKEHKCKEIWQVNTTSYTHVTEIRGLWKTHLNATNGKVVELKKKRITWAYSFAKK